MSHLQLFPLQVHLVSNGNSYHLRPQLSFILQHGSDISSCLQEIDQSINQVVLSELTTSRTSSWRHMLLLLLFPGSKLPSTQMIFRIKHLEVELQHEHGRCFSSCRLAVFPAQSLGINPCFPTD
ncbi:hypothetical protein AMECASPLE_002543 [Ameca splendens]|uniref:Uncharacterized protein n=1 Tax=Ameca splendens TaxID=208324 RepID=A0ABV0YKR6_9TELE